MSAKSLHQVYAESFSGGSLGHALYHPPSAKVLCPGSFGFFNERGEWNPIARLDDDKELKSLGFSRLAGQPKKAQPVPESWEVKTGADVSSTSVKVSVDLDAQSAGIPLSAEVCYKYSSAKGRGALLKTYGTVFKERYQDDKMYVDWVKKNKAALLERFSHEMKEHDLWIILSTYSVKKCSLIAWTEADKKVYLSPSFQVQGVGGGRLEVDWHKGTSGVSDWRTFGPEPNRLVVFAGAIRFEHKRTKVHISSRTSNDRLVLRNEARPYQWRGGETDMYEAEIPEEDREGGTFVWVDEIPDANGDLYETEISYMKVGNL